MKLVLRPSRWRTLRSGFTLVELLVVITILSILAGFAVVGIGGALNTGRSSQTKATVSLCNGVVQERLSLYQAVVVNNRPGYSIDRLARQTSDRYFAANATSLSPVAASHYARKVLFASVFPQRFQDLCGPDGLPGIAGSDDDAVNTITDGSARAPGTTPRHITIDLNELGLGGRLSDDPPTATAIRGAVERLGGFNIAVHDPATESAEMLYLAVTTRLLPDLPSLTPDDIPASFITDSDGDNLPELIDGWGNPLRFYTFSGGLLRGSATAGGATEWTWDTGTARTDIPAERAALGLLLGRSQVGVSSVGSGAISGTNVASVFHPMNRDFDDRFNSVRSPANTGLTADDASLASDTGFDLGGGTLAPGLPIPLGTLSWPMIVSAGPDGVLGLNEPNALNRGAYAVPIEPFALGSSGALDNVTNLQGRN